MKAKLGGFIGIGIAIIVALFVLGSEPSVEKPETVFHITLADPGLYENGIFRDVFEIEEGTYFFRFVPNGDSPQTMTISLEGDSLQYFEDFELVGTPYETGVSTYFTWDYLGEKSFTISQNQELMISIDPHGNLAGPVSVDIIEEY